MNLDISHHPDQDRLRLSLRQGGQRRDWWLTRRLVLAWVESWLAQLQAVALPAVAGLELPHDVQTEHRLALEFDGPAPVRVPAGAAPAPEEQWLLQELTLSVQPTGTVLTLQAAQQQVQIQLTRKESHAVLEMLARKARAAGWLNAPAWPDWLGQV